MNDLQAKFPWSPPEIWATLRDACAKADHPFRTPALITGCDQRNALPARIVVLRSADADRRELVFYTDRRSPKIAQIGANPAVGWLFYDPAGGIQIRAKALAVIHVNDEIAERAWAATPLSNRLNYCALKAPGDWIMPDEPVFPKTWKPGSPTLEESESGFANFAVVRTQASYFDLLRLEPGAMQRERLEWDGKVRAWAGGPVVP